MITRMTAKNKTEISRGKLYARYVCIVLAVMLLFSGCMKSGGNGSVNTAPDGTPDKNISDDNDNPSDASGNLPGNPDNAQDGSDSKGAPQETGAIKAPDKQELINPEGMTLDTRILPPSGYTRVPSEAYEITGFIRSLPLKPDGSQILKYDGRPVLNQDNHAAVFDIDIGDRDLQQCADSVIRIYAEYYWSIEEYDKIAFHLTNGFYMNYTKWRDGYRIRVEGNDVEWVKTASYDNSYETFLKYLNNVFAYAGTLSLSAESTRITLDDLLPGDILLEGGSPGHCVLVADMAYNEEGKRCFLLAQGYMPAQDFHVLTNPLHPDDPWYYEEELNYPIRTPSWTFNEGSLRRWAEFELEQWPYKALPASTDANPDNKSEVTLLAVGDNLIHIEVVQSGLKEDGSYNYDHLYDEIKDDIMAADIAVVNQETILGGRDLTYSGYPAFNSPTEIGDALINAGFDVVLHATNHTLDKGLQGVLNTLDYWDKHPEITVLGINRSGEDRNRIAIIEKNGIRIAMLNYTYGLNGYKIPRDRPYLVNLLDKDLMEADLKKARSEADFVVVFPHWGTEYSYEPSKSQKELVEFFYELGVDIVIGTHPHVLQPVELITSESGHNMLVYYSLGNFLSYQKEAARMLGGMAHVTITKDDTGTYISSASITPIVTHYEHGPADYSFGVYKLSEYTPEMGERHGVSDIAVQGAFSYEETVRTAKKVLGSWYQ